jgi:beta-N-acetylhexosaminidase
MIRQFLIRVFLLPLVCLFQGQAQSTDWVASTLKAMTVEEKVGQLFIADLVAVYSHKESPVYRYAVEMVKKYHVGGFILAGGTVTDIAVMTNSLQKMSKLPLIINADLESGLYFAHSWQHARGRAPELPEFIPGGGTGFPSLMAFGATGRPEYARSMGNVIAREARAIGIHWTNSPVADVNNNPANPIINTRSFGEDPNQVARFVAAYVKSLQDGRVVATLKHFPGHGDTAEDTHMGLPVLPFDQQRLDTMELIPFKAGIEAGAKAVMTAHLALPKIDSLNRPATLSKPIMTGLLREKLHFQGIIVTDGMTMQGVTDRFAADEASVLAIEAGTDALLVPADISVAYEGVLKAVKSHRISMERLDQSVRRMLSAKSWLGLPASRTVDIEKISDQVGVPESIALAEEISDKSVTLLRNNNALLPILTPVNIHLITATDDPNFQVGLELQRTLAKGGHRVVLTRLSNETSLQSYELATESTRNSDRIVVAVYLGVGSWKGKLGLAKPLTDYLADLAQSAKPVVLVAMGDPYVLGKLPTTDAVLACYSGARLAERSLGKAILGGSSITGKLPVTIPGKYTRGQGLELPAVSNRKGE